MNRPILPYVYKLSNLTTDEFYIGYRFKNTVGAELDLGINYFTSSKVVKPRFNEFNIEIIAEFFTAKDAFNFEQQMIAENINDIKCLNRHFSKDGSNHFVQKSPHTLEAKQRIGKAAKGRLRTEQWISKMRQAQLGKKHSQETRDKMSATRKGKVKTPEHLAKIGKALKGSGNMQKAILARAESQKKPCTIDGVKIYPSLKALSLELGFGRNGSRSPNLKFI